MEENSSHQTDPWDSAIFGSSLQSMYKSVPTLNGQDVSVPFPPPAHSDVVPPNVAPVIPRDIVKPVTPPSPIFSLRPDLANMSASSLHVEPVQTPAPTISVPQTPSVPPSIIRPAPTVPPMPPRPAVSMPQVSAPSPTYTSAPAYAVPQMQMPAGHSPYISAEQRAATLNSDTRQALRHANAGQLGQRTVAPISVAPSRPAMGNNLPSTISSASSRPLPMVLKAVSALLLIPMFGAGFLVADWSKKELARHDIQVTPEILQATLIRVQDVAENTTLKVERKIRSVVSQIVDTDISH